MIEDNKFTEEEIKEKLREIAQEAMKHYDKAMRAIEEPSEFTDNFVPFDHEQI